MNPYEIALYVRVMDDEFKKELKLIHKHLGAFLKELEETESENCDDTDEFDALFDEEKMEKYVALYFEKMRGNKE